MKHFAKFIAKTFLTLLIPALILIGIYVAIDPFKVVRDYSEFYPAPPAFQPWINQATVSASTWERQRHQRHYNAFLFGTSLSGHTPVEAWRGYIPADAQPFHFYSSWEGLESIAQTVELVDRDGADIDYALVFLTPRVFFKEYTYIPPEISTPRIQTTLPAWRYHWTFLSGFYHRDFLRSYIASKAVQRPIDVAGITAVDWQDAFVDTITNEMSQPLTLQRIHNDPDAYYKEHFWAEKLPPGHARVHIAGLTPRREAMLRRIADVFKRHHTDYHVILPPSAIRDIPNPADVAVLRRVFGERFHDLSSTMLWAADIDTLWFDDVHFTPVLPAMMLDSVYSRTHQRH